MPSLRESNESVYVDPKVIATYVNADYLEEAERSIIHLLEDQWHNFDMLDIAVGAGRTTQYFFPLVKSYTGADYSEGMIKACKDKYARRFPSARFLVSDMRSFADIPDHSFSFALISYNAISALNFEDQAITFQEMHRLLRPGGYLFFSAFNLQSVYRPDGIFSLKGLPGLLSITHPKQSYWALQSFFMRRFICNNPVDYWRWKKMSSAIINDGSHNFRLKHSYIRAAEQIRQLSTHFENIRVFARNGVEIIDTKEQAASESDWLFYLCVNKVENQTDLRLKKYPANSPQIFRDQAFTRP